MVDVRRELRGSKLRLLIAGVLLAAATVVAIPVQSVPSQAAVQVGAEAPDISLESIDGEALSLGALRGDKNVIVVFFRGTW